MGQSLRDLLVRQVSAPVGPEDPFYKDYFSKKYFDYSSEDPGNEAVKNRIYYQRLGELSWQDLLKQSIQRGVVQSGVPANKGAEDALIKRLQATGWSDDQIKSAIVKAADDHYGQHNSLFTEWSTPEGIAGYLGLPDFNAQLGQQQHAQFVPAHAKDAAAADANSRTSALQLASALLPFFGMMAAVPAAGAAAGAGAAGAGSAGALEAAAAFGGEAFGAAANAAGAFGGSVAPWTAGAAAGAGTIGGGMDWWTDLGLTAADVGMEAGAWTTNPALADLGGTIGSSAGNSLGGSLLETIKNLPTSALKSLGLTKPDGSLDGASIAGLLGKLGAAGLGAYASNQQAGALSDLANKYSEYGAPSRARFEASMTPGFDPNSIPGYAGALDSTSKSVLAKLSATGGNPFGSPGALIDANKAIVSGTALPAINEYQRLNLSAGGLGNLNAAIPALQSQAIGQDANFYNALGYGLNAATAPKQMSVEDLIKSFGIGGLT